jgi:hypothetical protein
MKRILNWSAIGAALIAGVLLAGGPVWAQLQQSGGPGSTVTANAGTNLNTSALALDSTVAKDGTLSTIDTDLKANIVLKAGSNIVGNFRIDQTTPGTTNGVVNNAGTNLIGLVREDNGCAKSVPFLSTTVGVATGGGTSVTSTTTCVTLVYINNITNSAVTFRLADKTGTPIIWVGGNADFSIPANSNLTVPMSGVPFSGGITAIAGTSAALNLQINGLQ